MTQDRGRKFQLDAMDVDETNFVAAAANVTTEFQRTKVIPEVDAYRYSKLAALAGGKSHKTEYTPTTTDILAKFLADIAAVQDVVGENEPLVVTMSIPAATILAQADKIEKRLDVTQFTQGGVQTKVNSIDNTPILCVPSARMNGNARRQRQRGSDARCRRPKHPENRRACNERRHYSCAAYRGRAVRSTRKRCVDANAVRRYGYWNANICCAIRHVS